MASNEALERLFQQFEEFRRFKDAAQAELRNTTIYRRRLNVVLFLTTNARSALGKTFTDQNGRQSKFKGFTCWLATPGSLQKLLGLPPEHQTFEVVLKRDKHVVLRCNSWASKMRLLSADTKAKLEKGDWIYIKDDLLPEQCLGKQRLKFVMATLHANNIRACWRRSSIVWWNSDGRKFTITADEVHSEWSVEQVMQLVRNKQGSTSADCSGPSSASVRPSANMPTAKRDAAEASLVARPQTLKLAKCASRDGPYRGLSPAG